MLAAVAVAGGWAAERPRAPRRPRLSVVGEVGDSESEFLARLRSGDEAAFRELVKRHDRAMRRIAMSFVQTPSVADEVVQETWLAVIHGLCRFEGRSSLKTWIFRILVNRAQSRGARESRIIPFSSLVDPADEQGGTVDPSRFLPPGSASRRACGLGASA